MKMTKRIIQKLADPTRPFKERAFMLLTITAVIAVLCALIGDIIYQENIVEIIALSVTVVLVPLTTFVSIYYGKVNIALRLIILGVVLVAVPVIFIYGGGIDGGGISWIIFAYLYIGLMMSGMWRRVMIVILTIVTAVLYALAYFKPDMIHEHSREVALIDCFLSNVLVGLVIFFIVWFQTRMHKAETARALEQTQKAEELNRSQNRFFSSMSHEIRTPINTVLGLNEIILRQEDASEEIIRDAKNIQGAGSMLLTLINDILDFSKIEAGSMDIVPVEYRVGDLISEIVNMIWLKAHEKGLLFVVDIDPGVPSELFGDEVRIKQILINLLNNAVKYTQQGTVTLHMESETIGENEVLLKISVSDTGMGIKQESIPYLFDAFQRVDQEKNRRIEGTGLGLSIVKQLIDLMGGSINVDSVYTQGSTFSVTIKQGIVSVKPVGNISISNSERSSAIKFEHSFRAPEAAVLIVDDNEMNLEVEEKLLDGTEMTVELCLSGKDALVKTLKRKYDLIFMDHLMPEMDGIACLENIRRQVGGLNRETPVIVLTANAGAENKELYNTSGFDGYLIKPVSGKQLEQCLIRHLPNEKLILNDEDELTHEAIDTAKGYIRKKPVLIATSTMCDLPASIVKDLQIEQIPFSIHTEEGVFWDGIETVSDELIRYMNENGGTVNSEPPTVSEFTEFFARKLRTSQHIIYISLTNSMSEEYNRAMKAAKTFDNVTILDSALLSSAVGILVLVACRLAQQNTPVPRIIEELEEVKTRINCSFVVADTEFMRRRGFISNAVSRVMTSMSIRPGLAVKNNKFGVNGFWMGSRKYCYEKYISHALPKTVRPDKGVLFITYADLPEEDLIWIQEKVAERFDFEAVVFQKASAAISSNCGPGTFGLLYMREGQKKYNIESYLMGELREIRQAIIEKIEDDEDGDEADIEEILEESAEPAAEPKWYEGIEGLDPAVAIKNSGSEDVFKNVLQIFYDSIPEKHSEIKEYYEKEDWESYTIKVHALKSSAKLIGAMELGKAAEALEMAGKSGDIGFIRKHTERLLMDCMEYRQKIEPYCTAEITETKKKDKPVADMSIMESLYEMIGEAAQDMDSDALEDALKEIEDYSIPDSESEKFEEIKKMIAGYDYDGIVNILQVK